MTGFTFLNAGFWPWLLALGVPILIHLLTKRTRQTVVLPTFQFLQRSLAQQSQVFRLKRWLLLALRLLVLLFLVLTFLKPTWTAPLARSGERGKAILIVLDTSLSMNAETGGISSLARARAQAQPLLEDLRRGDRANVILAQAAPHPVLPTPGDDFGALRQAVTRAAATAERGNMAAAVAMAAEQMAGVEAGQKELVLASDFQRTNWADVQFNALPPDVKLVFLNTTDNTTEESASTAVTGLQLRPNTPRAGEEAEVVAEVWNGSRAPRTLAVQLEVTGEKKQPLPTTPPQSVTIPAYATGSVRFPFTFADSGRYRVTARIGADSLPQDNARFLAADLRHSQTVLLLTDADLTGGSGAYFLMRALNPTPDLPGGVRVVPKHAVDLSGTDLKASDVVILTEVTTLPADKMPLLYRYVSEGGALIVFLNGPRIVDQMQAFQKLAGRGEGLPFLPQIPMNVRRQGKGYVTLTEVRYSSPLLKLFKDPQAADLSKIHFTRFYIPTEPDERTEVLLKFEDSTPAAARRTLGAGSVLLCNFSASPADSDLAKQEVFPPLLHEFLKGMTKKEGERREFTPGGLASATIDASQAAGTVRAVGPQGQAESLTVDKTSGSVLVERVEAPGFHTILANGQEAVTIAVNTHPDESDLRPIDPRELESRRSSRASYLVNGGGENASAALDHLRHPRPLWHYFLLFALLTLLLEHLVAAFGGKAKVRQKRPEAGGRRQQKDNGEQSETRA